MLDGRMGKATQKAMELLVRYAEALGAERFVDTRNVAGVPGSANPFLQNYYKDKGAEGLDAIFSHFDLDSDELVEAQPALVPTLSPAGRRRSRGLADARREGRGLPELPGARGVRRPSTTSASSRPARRIWPGTFRPVVSTCAWMESSAVIYANSVLGARTNTEGRESTSAAMLTGKIPDWGLHRTEHRYGTHRIDVDVAVDSVMDWGMLGYYVGDVVQERIPVRGRPLQRTGDRPPETFRRGGLELRRRRDVPHRRRDAGGRVARDGVRSEDAGRDLHLRQGRAAQRVRSPQCERQRSERGFRDARLPACGDRAAERGGATARWQEGERQLQPVDLHVARGQEPGSTTRAS